MVKREEQHAEQMRVKERECAELVEQLKGRIDELEGRMKREEEKLEQYRHHNGTNGQYFLDNLANLTIFALLKFAFSN